MTQIVTDASPVFYTAEPVVNADHTIIGSNGRMISYSGLTAARVLTLPPATQMMQTIMIMDEDGSCNLTNSITLTCAGTDKIEGNSTRILNYPYSALTIESNGSGSWVVVANPNPSLSAGIQIAPTFTDNGDGSITFTSGLYCFYTNSSGIGKIKRFTLPGTTFTLTDNTNQYIVADYNAGSPTIYVTTDVSVIDEITVIPVYTIYRRGTVLHILEWDSLGDALGNKTHKSIVKTQRFRTEPGGLGLGEAATRLVTVGSGTVWHGAVSNSLSAFNSSVNTMWLAYHVAGVWTFSTITQYNNTQWDDGTNLQTLPGGKYAVNFVYRVVGTNDTTTIVFLGQGAYSLGDAQASQPPAYLPGEVLSHAVLVGRIIVNQGGSTATQIDSAFSTIFSPAGVTDHNSLLNLQGGTGGQYYHLTSAEYTGTGTGNFVRASGPSVATPTFTTSATFSYLTSGRVPFSTTGGSLIDNANLTYTAGTGLKVSDTTASTDPTNGALVVSGGVGVSGKSFFGNDCVAYYANPRFIIQDSSVSGYAELSVGNPTNGIVYFGRENGAGTGWGATPYAGLIYTTGTQPFQMMTNGVVRFTVNGAGGVVYTTPIATPTGGAVASATTITPTGQIFHVTGTTAIATINLPFTGFTGSITIIPDGIFTTTTAGNIALASTAAVNKALIMTYDGTKWYPSY